jgi:HEAT repeat protein
MSAGANRRQTGRRRVSLGTLLFCAVAALPWLAIGQEPSAPQAASQTQLQAAIDKLGDLDYTVRTNASRTVRRTQAGQAVPALRKAVSEHTDGYVRFRALVLLTGFNDPRTVDTMREVLPSPNDRLRTVAYSFFEHHPDRAIVATLVAALGREQGEFVRPALVRALAASVDKAGGDAARLQSLLIGEASRGENFFRSAVIEALGDYKARYAVDTLTAIAKLDGPLQDDAALALGKIGDRRALVTLAALQQSAPRNAQPLIATAVCLLGVNCDSHRRFLVDTIEFAGKNPGFQDLLRGAAAGLAALAVAGDRQAFAALLRVGVPAQEDAMRAPIGIAVATVVLRVPGIWQLLPRPPGREHAVELLAEGFDRLEEDLDKEAYFASMRRTYWNAAEESPARSLALTLIQKLDF